MQFRFGPEPRHPRNTLGIVAADAPIAQQFIEQPTAVEQAFGGQGIKLDHDSIPRKTIGQVWSAQ